MGLETGTYVNDLVITNPVGGDERRLGDDHLRLIKSVLKNTFPDATVAFRFPRLTGSTISASASLVADDNGKILLLDSAGSSFTLSLPSASGLVAGWSVQVKNVGDPGGNGNNFVVIDPSGSETIEGSTAFNIYPGEDITILRVSSSGFTVLGESSRVLMGFQTTSGSALNFALIPGGRFRSFEFELAQVIPVTSGVDLDVRFSDDNGATFETSGYVHSRIGVSNPSTVGGSGTGPTSEIIIASGLGNDVPNVYHLFGNMWLTAGAAVFTILSWEVGYVAPGGVVTFITGLGRWGVGANAIAFFPSSGSFADGIIRMYGLV